MVKHSNDKHATNKEWSTAVGRILFGLTHRLRGSRSLTLLRQIAEGPHLSPSEIQAAQFRRLSELLAHAETHVPYYREIFRELGIRSQDVRNLRDFARLPILTKDIIRQRYRDLVRDDVPSETLSIHHSGGSTGVPVTFYRDHLYMAASEAGTFRNLRQAGWSPGEMIAFFWGANESINKMSRWQFELRQQMRRMYQFDPFNSGRVEMEHWLQRWRTLGASVALGYASTIARFAQFIETAGARIAPLKGVFTTAEKLYKPQRDAISRAFGCRAFDLYGSSEVQNIAAECPLGSMHINSDFVVLETDHTAGSGNGPAPFIITSLWNRAMPFIRYRNEDYGELIEGSCDCGNNFPLMRLDIARVSDNFTLPGGRIVHGEFFTHLMYGKQGIENFQFHQTAPDRIILWIVPSSQGSNATVQSVDAVVKQIKALVPEQEIKVEVRKTEEIPLSSAGKHRFTRSDVQVTAM
jgi:phenylacetate-CoA ligase